MLFNEYLENTLFVSVLIKINVFVKRDGRSMFFNRLTAIDANWRQIRMTLKRRGRQMASWMPHLTLMLISREGYELGP